MPLFSFRNNHLENIMESININTIHNRKIRKEPSLETQRKEVKATPFLWPTLWVIPHIFAVTAHELVLRLKLNNQLPDYRKMSSLLFLISNLLKNSPQRKGIETADSLCFCKFFLI